MNRSISPPSPLSPTLWPTEAFVWWRSLLYAVGYLVVYLIPAAILGTWVALKYGRFAISTLPLGVVVGVQLVTYVPEIAYLLWLLPVLAHRSLRELGLRVPRARDLAWGFGGALAMIAVATAIGSLEQRLLHLKIEETAVDLLRGAHGLVGLAFAFLAVVAAPFVEELTFRGFVFNALLRYVPPVAAAIGSALLFGLAHLDPHSPTAVAPLAGGGLVLAWVYYRSGSLVASMLSHGSFNLVTVIGVLVFHQR